MTWCVTFRIQSFLKATRKGTLQLYVLHWNPVHGALFIDEFALWFQSCPELTWKPRHPVHRSCSLGLLAVSRALLRGWELPACSHPAPLPRMTSPMGKYVLKVPVWAVYYLQHPGKLYKGKGETHARSWHKLIAGIKWPCGQEELTQLPKLFGPSLKRWLLAKTHWQHKPELFLHTHRPDNLRTL